jgi:hypothetical protein
MKLLTYAPDLDPITDGALLECDHVVPTWRGISSAPSAADVNQTVVAATVIGAASLIKVSGDVRTFVGTANRLYEESGSDWTEVSEGTTAYASSVTDRWRFAQYGDVSLAAAKEIVLQYSDGSGNFAKVTSTATGSTVTAPTASIVEIVNDFVFLGNTNAGPVFTSDNPDRWWCSAIGDYARWTPDIAVQCATGRLSSIPGKITAVRKFGDQVVIFKERGMYLGSYEGPPIVWRFPEIPTANTGTWCQESVIQIGTPEQPLLFFVGRDDFYVFDGARPVPVGLGVKDTFFANLNVSEADQIICLHDRNHSRVYVYYPTGSSTTLSAALVYNYRTKKWGADNRSIEYAFEYLSTGVTYNDLGTFYSTYDDFPSSSYDEAFPSSNTPQPAFFNTSHDLYTLTGSGTSATFATRDFGTDGIVTAISRVRPRWIVAPDSGSMVNYYWWDSGDNPTTGSTTTMSTNSRFDLLRSAAWHRFTFTLTGDWELNSLEVDAREDGLAGSRS